MEQDFDHKMHDLLRNYVDGDPPNILNFFRDLLLWNTI